MTAASHIGKLHDATTTLIDMPAGNTITTATHVETASIARTFLSPPVKSRKKRRPARNQVGKDGNLDGFFRL